jgi:hypothetical protein
MHGPKPPGHWTHLTAANCGTTHSFLTAGRRYRVVQRFADYDGVIHPEHEEWIFLGYSYLPYESGMSFFVSLDGVHEWHIRLQWRPEEQGEVLDHLDNYLGEVSDAS